MIRWTLFILGLCSCCCDCGCSSRSLFAKKITTKASYETCAAISSEDMKYVKEFNKKAVEEMTSGCEKKAETLLKKALSIDPNCGKAHYNLGVLYAKQCNYYLAALEFEKAQNLMKDDNSRHNLIKLGYNPPDVANGTVKQGAPTQTGVDLTTNIQQPQQSIPSPPPLTPPSQPQGYNVPPKPQYSNPLPQYASPASQPMQSNSY